METMASRGIAVEICLSSNAQILEVSGAAHPLAAYLAAKVPVSLATDDQAVSRSSMKGEWVRAVTDQHLGYLQLKAMARNSLQHSFLPGQSLFTSLDPLVADQACAPTQTSLLGDEVPAADCAALLASSARAAAQWGAREALPGVRVRPLTSGGLGPRDPSGGRPPGARLPGAGASDTQGGMLTGGHRRRECPTRRL
jgi:hypothetical protein